MSLNSLVSVIVPCYNQAQYLDEALQSVLDQTYINWECIIVNDGSRDHTEIVAKKWTKKDSRFIYLFKENGGLSSARNFGIKAAKGEFILTLDADDKYEPTFMEKGVHILEDVSNIGVVSSWYYRFVGDKKYSLFQPKGETIKDFLFNNAAIGTSLFRKVCWEEAGGYDEKMKSGYEDWEYYIRVCKKDWTVHIIQEPLFLYRQHPVSMRIVALKQYDSVIRKYIYLKHKELYKEYYDDLIEYSLYVIDLERHNVARIHEKIDFKLGTVLLRPFRIIKSFFFFNR
jgi:glycosyltransferase involved in cell wall biosynthesis